MTTDLTDQNAGRTIDASVLRIETGLNLHVSALVAVTLGDTGPLPLAIAPHDHLVLTVQFGLGADAIDAKNETGRNTHLTGIRHWTGAFAGAGRCVTLFALLTPLGAVQLLHSRRMDVAQRIRAPVVELLDAQFTRALELRVAQATDLPGKLMVFAECLEQQLASQRKQSRAALRAARAAMRLRTMPQIEIEQLASEQHISRRQLERDFDRWLGVSPRHYAQVARVQTMARRVRRGTSLSAAAADLSFADQPHMNRVVRQLTGLTPRGLLASRRSPLADVFHAATSGGTVYL
jgi:AraC-like DNA-binding protein